MLRGGYGPTFCCCFGSEVSLIKQFMASLMEEAEKLLVTFPILPPAQQGLSHEQPW